MDKRTDIIVANAALNYVARAFLPRCMECRRGLAMGKLSVCLSVRLSNACIVTKRKKDLSRFFIPYERSFSLVFQRLVGATSCTWNFGSSWPRWSEIADLVKKYKQAIDECMKPVNEELVVMRCQYHTANNTITGDI